MQIIYSNAHESLLSALYTRIEKNSDSRQILVFPSQALKSFYSDHLCQLLGSTLSLDLILPDQLYELCIELGAIEAEKSIRPSHRSADYRLVLLQLFIQFQKSPDEESSKWLRGSPLEAALSQDPMAISAIAASLGSLFCQYSQWALSKDCFFKPVQDWQSYLWAKVHQVLDPAYCLASQWFELGEKIDSFHQNVELHLVGFSQAYPGFLAWAEKVSSFHPLTWYVHSPSRLYWHDLESYLRGQKQLARVCANISAHEQLQALLLDRNPLLASLCQVARPLMQYLEQKQTGSDDAYHLFANIGSTDVYKDLWWQDLPFFNTSINLLKALQTDLLLMRPLHEGQLLELDDQESLSIYDCVDPDQEVAIVKEKIHALFEKEPDLLPSDIMVLAPDIHIYRGFIERHFDDFSDYLPYKVLDSLDKEREGAKEFILALGNFAQGLWSWENWMQLLNEPWLIQEASSLKISSWFRQVERECRVSWGLNCEHRLLVAKEKEWALVDEAGKGSWKAFWSHVFHLAILESDQAASEAFEAIESQESRLSKAFFGSLEKGLHPWIYREFLSPSQWAKQLQNLLEELFPNSMDAFVFLEKFWQKLETYPSHLISGRDFNELMQSYLDDRPSVWSSRQEGLLRFASLQPMRAIPVKHLFIMGLSQHHFPAPQPRAGYEWSLNESVGVRPSPSELYRYAFLEALLSARQSLSLTYSAEPASLSIPCAILANLLAYLKAAFKLKTPVLKQVKDGFKLVKSHHLPSQNLTQQDQLSEPVITSLPSQISLSQINYALTQPVSLYLEHHAQIRPFKRRSESSQLCLSRSFSETYLRLSQMDHNIDEAKLIAYWDKCSLSHLESDIWKKRLTSHREYRKQYLELELQEPHVLLLSAGRRWLNLPDETSLSLTYSQSVKIESAKASFEITGQTQAFDLKKPQIQVRKTAKEARKDLIRALVDLSLYLEKGLIETRSILLLPKDSNEKPKIWDLSDFDSSEWLKKLAEFLEACYQQPLLFGIDFHQEAFESSTLESYESILCSQIESSLDDKNRRYSSQYIWGLYFSNSRMWKTCLEYSFEKIHTDLKALYKPIFQVYPLSSKKEKDDEI